MSELVVPRKGLEFVSTDAEILRRPAALVEAREFGTPELRETVDELLHKLTVEKKGVAITANQAGIDKQIKVMQTNVGRKGEKPLYVVEINTEILELSPTTQVYTEACFSTGDFIARVERPDWVVVRYRTVDGEEVIDRYEDYLAQEEQHENDHENGVLVFDHMLTGRATHAAHEDISVEGSFALYEADPAAYAAARPYTLQDRLIALGELPDSAAA